MNIVGIIPARYGSSRFEGKPLVNISGGSRIERVYRQCQKTKLLADIVVATADTRILDHVIGFGGKAVMTSDKHRSGTERCNEALSILVETMPQNVDGVINIQGDEPFIDPAQIDKLALLLHDEKVEIATLMKKINDKTELFNENVVKVVINRFSKALYFSRNPIPFCRGIAHDNWISSNSFYKHIGIYAYRSDVLKILVTQAPESLELAESLEQLRWLSNGYSIDVAETETESIAIDTPDDLTKVLNTYF